MATYSVRPFSGKNYARNSDTYEEGSTPCAICGKPVVGEWKHTAIVIDGGANWGDESSSDTGDGGYMGCFPIGPDCHRRYVVK